MEGKASIAKGWTTAGAGTGGQTAAEAAAEAAAEVAVQRSGATRTENGATRPAGVSAAMKTIAGLAGAMQIPAITVARIARGGTAMDAGIRARASKAAD